MLITLTLGESISAIGKYAFKNCPYLLNIYAKMELPPVIEASVFEGCGDLSGITLYIPQGSMPFYRKADVWKEFNLQEMDYSALEQTSANPEKMQKCIIDGQLFILHDGNTYTLQGQEIK